MDVENTPLPQSDPGMNLMFLNCTAEKWNGVNQSHTPKFEVDPSADPADANNATLITQCLLVNPSLGGIGLGFAYLVCGYGVATIDRDDPDAGLSVFIGGRLVGTVTNPIEGEEELQQFFHQLQGNVPESLAAVLAFNKKSGLNLRKAKAALKQDQMRRVSLFQSEFIAPCLDDEADARAMTLSEQEHADRLSVVPTIHGMLVSAAQKTFVP